eukprot:755834-Hanusia_phi.AAC.1
MPHEYRDAGTVRLHCQAAELALKRVTGPGSVKSPCPVTVSRGRNVTVGPGCARDPTVTQRPGRTVRIGPTVRRLGSESPGPRARRSLGARRAPAAAADTVTAAPGLLDNCAL